MIEQQQEREAFRTVNDCVLLLTAYYCICIYYIQTGPFARTHYYAFSRQSYIYILFRITLFIKAE